MSLKFKSIKGRQLYKEIQSILILRLPIWQYMNYFFINVTICKIMNNEIIYIYKS